MSFPFIPIYFEKRGLALGTIGLILAGNLVAHALGTLIGGRLTDDLGARKTMILSLRWRTGATVCLCAGILSHAPAPLIAAIVFGVTFVGHAFQPACDVYIASRFSYSDRNSAFSLMRVGVNAGWALGPAIGGLLAHALGYGALFLLTALLTLMNTRLLDQRLPFDPVKSDAPDIPSRPPFSVWLISLKNSVWRSFLAVNFLAAIAYSQIFTLLSLYCSRFQGQGEAAIGLLFGWNGVLVVATQLWVTRLFRNWALTAMNALGLAIYAAGYLLIAGASAWLGFFAAVTIVTMGEVIHSPALTALTANMASNYGGDNRQGLYVGLAQFTATLGSLAASVSGGYLLDHVGRMNSSLPWFVAAAVAMAAALGYHLLSRLITSREVLGLRMPVPARLAILK
ncbi:MAG: MFS transporter [Elusimicrobia bacterium]|nr:MFS transporter [Elusimicrobiota bacterium]